MLAHQLAQFGLERPIVPIADTPTHRPRTTRRNTSRRPACGAVHTTPGYYTMMADLNTDGCFGMSCPDNPTHGFNFDSYMSVHWGQQSFFSSTSG
jgi:hypothetical protein